MNSWPTFADWQLSRRIVPWVVIHNFSEADYLRWQMKQRTRFAMRQITEPFVVAMGRLAHTFAAAADALAEFAAAFTKETP